MKSECYEFEVETYVTHAEEVRLATNRAEVVFTPDSSMSNQLRLAEVTLAEGVSGGQKTAQAELIKLLVGYCYPSSEIVESSSSPKMVRGRITRDTGKDTGIMTKTASGRYVKPFNPESPMTLRINVNSDSPAIRTYYEAMCKNNSFDRYREMFRIIEYFSVRNRRASQKTIKETLGYSWWIPEHANDKLKELLESQGTPNKNTAEYLWEVRSGVRHLKHGDMKNEIGYGKTAANQDDVDEVTQALEIIHEIVKHTLEKHHDTRLEPV